MSSNLPLQASNPVTLVSQALTINKQTAQPNKVTELNDEQAKKPVVIEAELLKRGDKASQQQADELFAQANSYAQISPKVKQSLQAYQSFDISNKRETISSLMGIDLYA